MTGSPCRTVMSMTDDNLLEIPEHELHSVYSTLADATEAAAAGDTNGCAKLAAEAKQQVIDIHEEYRDD